MNYRHAFHAGNFADVMKHAVLALVLAHLKRKEAPFRVIDTHAGIGLYDLEGVEAGKTGEWRQGIGRLIGPDAAPLTPAVAELLAPYLDVVRACNPSGLLRHYPGSPRIARALIRRDDALILNELHPEDHAALSALFARDPQVKVLGLDAWIAAKSLLPPRERRGVVLIDPPYESKDELQRLARGLAEAVKRFATGVFLLWYPVKDLPPIDAFHAGVTDLGLGKTLRIELTIRRADDATRLNGCGLLAVNPPWPLHEQLKIVLPELSERLAQGAGAGWRVEAGRT